MTATVKVLSVTVAWLAAQPRLTEASCQSAASMAQTKMSPKKFFVVVPLTRLLAKDAPFIFDNECYESFQTLKQALISDSIIQPPDWMLPFEIMCDASDFAVGAVLGQTKDKKHYAISYARKTLTGP